MTDPSPRKEAEDCWQTALIRMEPNQIRLIASYKFEHAKQGFLN